MYTSQLNNGLYTIRLSIYDDDGRVGRDWFIVSIANASSVFNNNSETWYWSIQAAVDDAEEGDTIYISSREYYENVRIKKSLSLIGENKYTTIIDGCNIRDVVEILRPACNVNISGFTIRNGYMAGVLIYESSNNNVYNNIIANNTNGISVEESSNNVFFWNTIIDNTKGIYIDHVSDNNLIYHNNFINNTENAQALRYGTNKWDEGYPSGGNYWDDYIENGGYDSDGDGIGEIPYLIPGNYNKDLYPHMNHDGWINNGDNLPPQIPTIFSDSSGWIMADKNYTFTARSTDPDGIFVYYMWDFGDGTVSDWMGPYVSGSIAGASHAWTQVGIYQIRVKAKDIHGAESESWSDPIEVMVLHFTATRIDGGHP